MRPVSMLFIVVYILAGCGSQPRDATSQPPVTVNVGTDTLQTGQVDFYSWLDSLSLSLDFRRQTPDLQSAGKFMAWVEDSQVHDVGSR